MAVETIRYEVLTQAMLSVAEKVLPTADCVEAAIVLSKAAKNMLRSKAEISDTSVT